MTKICSKCKVEKALTSFWKSKRSSSGLLAACIACYKISHAKYLANPENKAKRRHYNRLWRKTTSKGRAFVARHARKSTLKYRYNLSIAQYDQMLQQQKGVCAICAKPQMLTAKHLFVDHCHQTGQIRALLCHPCNAGLGSFKDNAVILQRAANYLKKYGT